MSPSEERIAANAVTHQLIRLPYSTTVESPPILGQSESLIDWIRRVHAWLTGYQEAARVAMDVTAQMKTELDQLRAQRAAIRSFMGTD